MFNYHVRIGGTPQRRVPKTNTLHKQICEGEKMSKGAVRAGVSAFCGLFFLSQATGLFASGNGERTLFNGIVGSGHVVSEVRDVNGFEGVTINGAGEVNLSPGPAFRVEVVADDNVLPYLTTDVRGGVLILSSKPGISIRNTNKIKFNISIPKLSSATIKGSGSIFINGTARGEKLAVSIEGSGSIKGSCDVATLKTAIMGSGGVNIQGRANSEEIRVGGSGAVDNREVSADDVTVSIAGSGDVWVTAQKSLDVSITGSGNLHYAGTVRPSVKSAGSGKVMAF